MNVPTGDTSQHSVPNIMLQSQTNIAGLCGDTELIFSYRKKEIA